MRADTGTLWRLVLGLAVALIALMGLMLLMFLRLGSQAATQAQIHRVELASCGRENTLRRADNNAHFGDYVVFSFVVKRFTAPTKTETAAQKKITQEFGSALNKAVAYSSWTPPTKCTLAVNEQGAKYTSPAPVSFSTRLPPASALPAR